MRNAHINMAKGAKVKSKWLEWGERNSSYFLALEIKGNNISALMTDHNIINNHLDIAKYEWLILQ